MDGDLVIGIINPIIILLWVYILNCPVERICLAGVRNVIDSMLTSYVSRLGIYMCYFADLASTIHQEYPFRYVYLPATNFTIVHVGTRPTKPPTYIDR